MKLYNINNKCKKCGGGASTTFSKPKGIILRVCATCGYSWYEIPLDEVVDDNESQNLLVEGE